MVKKKLEKWRIIYEGTEDLCISVSEYNNKTDATRNGKKDFDKDFVCVVRVG